MPVSSIAKVAIVLCYCSVFEKLIVSSKSLFEVLEKFFECLETRTSILETRSSKLEPRYSMFDSQKLRGSRIEFRVETVNLHLPGTVMYTVHTFIATFLIRYEAEGRSSKIALLPFFDKILKTHVS